MAKTMTTTVIFVTGNKTKIETATHYLAEKGITVLQEKVSIDEIQSESIEEVAIDKAKKAYEILKKPLFVNDSGWLIPALNGFPGPYMKYINQWFTPEDFLNVMKNKKDDTIILREVYVYFDGSAPKVFSYDYMGKILKEKKGEGLPSDTVITLSADQRTIAEKSKDLKSSEYYNKFWDDFPTWLETQN